MVADPGLHWLFVDLNSYFASAEQELRPELRGLPIAVVPVEARTTCCIAVSYQARRYGVCTGMRVAEAQARCPHLQLVEARPKTYVELHHRLRAAIESCLPVQAALSCDEFCCELTGSQQQVARAVALADMVKAAVRGVGSTLRCSVGLGPNRLLAKIAAGMQKPDGLFVIERRHLPEALFCAELRDVPGIGGRMERRLRQNGISSVRQLCTLSRGRMESLWGSVEGARLWMSLRGEDLPPLPLRAARSISRQHILPPAQRNPEGARQVALKMLQDCVRRLWKQGAWAGGVGLAVYYLGHDQAFEAHHRIQPCQDAITLQEQFLPLLDGAPRQTPMGLCVFLFDLSAGGESRTMFPAPGEQKRAAVSQAMQDLQCRFGKDAVYLASVHGVRKEAPTRISFGPPLPLDEF